MMEFDKDNAIKNINAQKTMYYTNLKLNLTFIIGKLWKLTKIYYYIGKI